MQTQAILVDSREPSRLPLQRGTKSRQSPFIIDTSEPDKLIGRGTEDDKGAIATALYAMKAS